MTQTRFIPDIDLDGLAPDEAFAILGNEIRLDIVRVLWQAGAAHEYDDGVDTAETMSYSELQTGVHVDDNGKFNYHLSQLDPHFIRRTDEGYRLSAAGKRIARTVISVSGADSLDFSTTLEEDCPLCGGEVSATYDDQWLRIQCAGCDGLFGDQAPAGTLFLTNFPAAGFSDRSPEQALAAGLYRCALDITYLLYGVCRECAGHISSSVTVCDAHDVAAAERCGSCGTPFQVWAEMRCDTCGFAKRLPVEMYSVGLCMVTGALDTRELDIHAISFEQAIDVLRNRVETSVSEDPLRITIGLALETGPISVTLDDDMNVVDIDRSHRSVADPS